MNLKRLNMLKKRNTLDGMPTDCFESNRQYDIDGSHLDKISMT